MVDGLGLAETTPGPLILVTQFVGFLAAHREAAPFDPLVAAVLGAMMTTWTTFAPSFLFIFAGAPYIEDIRGNRRLAGALAAITAAVVGVILNLAAWFTLHVLFHTIRETQIGFVRLFAVDLSSIDVAAAVLTAFAAILVFALHRGLIETIALMAALGIGWRLILGA
jgi:chromate transporter